MATTTHHSCHDVVAHPPAAQYEAAQHGEGRGEGDGNIRVSFDTLKPSGGGADNESTSSPRFINDSSIPYYKGASVGTARGLM